MYQKSKNVWIHRIDETIIRPIRMEEGKRVGWLKKKKPRGMLTISTTSFLLVIIQ